MDHHARGEALTLRTGAVLLPLGILLFVVSTGLFHPSEEDPMNNAAVFAEYARSDSWIAIHFAQWLAALALIGGLLSISHSIAAQPGPGAAMARYGHAAALVTATAFTMLQAVDGVALKWAVDTWTTAPVEQQSAAFAAALSVRWIEYALQSYSNILLGLALLLYALAIAFGTTYPRRLGWLAGGAGVAWIVHGAMVPYAGFFDSIPRLAAIVLFSLWSFFMAIHMWRLRSAGPAARTGPVSPTG